MVILSFVDTVGGDGFLVCCDVLLVPRLRPVPDLAKLSAGGNIVDMAPSVAILPLVPTVRPANERRWRAPDLPILLCLVEDGVVGMEAPAVTLPFVPRTLFLTGERRWRARDLPTLISVLAG